MNNIYIGKIMSTHGIKGELKIKSEFLYKEKVFAKNKKIIINNIEYIIKSHRVHKDYNMVTLNEYTNINEVLFLLKEKVYIKKEELNLSNNEILDDELITYKVITTDKEIGNIIEIFNASKTNKILRIKLEKEILIPLNSPFVKDINKQKKEIIIERNGV